MTPQPGTAGTDDDPLDSIATEQLVVNGEVINNLVGLAFDSANASDGVLRFDGTGSTNGITDGSAKVLVGGTVYDVAGGEWVDFSGTSHSLDSWEKVINSQFNVTITGTNGPVQPGNTLDVTVDVSNAGTDQDTQTVTLSIDNSVGQVDSASVTLSGGGSTTQTLSWAVPSGQTKQDYQAAVASADDTASQTVTVVSGIPSSVVTQFTPSTFATGDGTWADSVGSNDITISGNPQSVTLNDGSDGVSGDGTDDYGLFSFPLDGSQLQNFAIEFQYQTTATSSGAVMAIVDNMELQIYQNLDHSFDSNGGNFYMALQDSAGTKLDFGPSSSPNVNDGTVHNIILNVVDSTSGDVAVLVDGTNQSLSFNNSNTPSNFTSWGADMGVFARNISGIGDYANTSLGVVRIHDTDISGPTI